MAETQKEQSDIIEVEHSGWGPTKFKNETEMTNLMDMQHAFDVAAAKVPKQDVKAETPQEMRVRIEESKEKRMRKKALAHARKMVKKKKMKTINKYFAKK